LYNIITHGCEPVHVDLTTVTDPLSLRKMSRQAMALLNDDARSRRSAPELGIW